MKVAYVVTAGEYSDYHIVGVFSTPQIADREAARHQYGRVENYAVNDCDIKLGAWCVWMATRNTSADSAAPAGTWPSSKKFARYEVTYATWGDGCYFGTPPKFCSGGGYVTAFGKTKAHAIRSASNAIRKSLVSQ